MWVYFERKWDLKSKHINWCNIFVQKMSVLDIINKIVIPLIDQVIVLTSIFESEK